VWVCARLVWALRCPAPAKCYTHLRGMCYASRMTCAHCGANFDGRADARTCSTRCRVARHRQLARFAPARLRDADRWVRHIAKRPVQADGSVASSTDAATWCEFGRAFASDVGDGVGFVLNGDGVVCVDLDGCLVDGVPTEWGKSILDLFPGAPVEVSLSGNGLHVWGTGPLVSRVVTVFGGKVEVYADKRYIAMTGVWMRRGELVDLSDGIAKMGLR